MRERPAVVHLFHEGIVPGATYEIQVIDSTCDVNNEDHYSPPLTVTTARFGDIVSDCSTQPCGPADGNVTIVDALADVLNFIGDYRRMIRARAEIEPRCQDLVINISDVLHVLNAFSGVKYPFTPSAANPCDSICSNPLA